MFFESEHLIWNQIKESKKKWNQIKESKKNDYLIVILLNSISVNVELH